MKNEIMLITYADSLGNNLSELEKVLKQYFYGAVGAVHILPFFPSSADRGFAPICYDEVDERFGNFDDVRRLADEYDLMFDFMVNHISKHSLYFKDFLLHGEQSPYRDFFINYQQFWGGEPSEEELSKIYRRNPRAPYIEVQFADGNSEKLWCTFSEEQIDINVSSEVTKQFICKTLEDMCRRGAKIIRLDAFAYAVKKRGSSCFFAEPEIWELLSWIQGITQPYGVEILPEVHEHYSIALKLAEHGYWTYDFALPLLLLHALYTGRTDRLVHWLTICPRRQFTTLDTHDGIGVVDAVDLLTQEEIDETKEWLFSKGANVKRIYNTEQYNNLDVYQVNCTYYSALGNDDKAYLLARAIQFFAPGIPQVYYVGMLAGKNDIALLEETKEGRNINRHYYSMEEVKEEVQRPVVRALLSLMRFRNRCAAFSGEISLQAQGSMLTIRRINGASEAELSADLKTHDFTVYENGNPLDF